MERTVECFRGFLDCLEGAVEKGVVYGKMCIRDRRQPNREIPVLLIPPGAGLKLDVYKRQISHNLLPREAL